MKILTGVYEANGGQILEDGKPLQFKNTKDAEQHPSMHELRHPQYQNPHL
jgi:ABC-type uncharacterized transport system ATPase subunit